MQKRYAFFFFTLLFLTASSISGQSVEGFNYGAGATLEGLSGGENWGGDWMVLKGNDQAAITEGGITVPAVGASSPANHIYVMHSGTGGLRAFRKFSQPITDDGNTYYFSWFQDADYAEDAPGGSVAQAIITLGDNFGAGGPGGQLVRMGKIFGSEAFGVDGANGLGAQTVAGTNTREGYFAVAKVSLSGNAAVDTVRIFLNPDLTATELNNADADMTRTPSLNNGFDAFGFKVEGGSVLNSAFDEFRFGTSVQDVIGNDLVGIPGVNTDQFNDYTAGSNLDGGAAGAGWGGPWAMVGGDNPAVTEGGIDNFSILRATSGNHIDGQFSGANGNTRFLRPLNAPFPDDGSTYYFSYSQISTYTNRGQQVNYFMLIDQDTYGPTGPGGQLVQIGKNLNTPFIGAGIGGTNNFEMTAALAEEAHLVVVKVSTSGNSDPDTVRVFIDPQPDSGEPGAADATKLIGTNLNNGFDAVGFKVEGLVAGNTMAFDDVMVGQSFEDVIPTDRELLEPLSNAFAVESFNTYAEGAELIGLDAGQGWAGEWQSFDVSDSAVIRSQGLVNETLLVRTNGNSVRMNTTGSNQRIIRYLEQPVDTASVTDFWFATQLAVSGNVNGNVGNFILADTSREGRNFQQVIIGKGFGNRSLFAGGFGGGGNQPSGETFGDDASWVVGHFTRDTGVWSLDLFVNPDPAAGEPAEATANIINKPYPNAGNFNAVVIKAEGGGIGLNWDVDDIYLGGAFADIIPLDLQGLPNLPPGAAEPFDYATGTAVAGQIGGSGWAGPWRPVSAEATAATVEDGVSSFPLAKATAGPSLELVAYQRLVRPLQGSYGDNGRDYWIGWWMDVTDVGANVVQFVLADTATYAANGPGGQLIQIGNLFSDGMIGGVPGGTAAGVTAEDGHFFVAHVVTNGSAANDEVFVWVDPALDVTPSSDTASFVASADLSEWNALGLKFEGNAGLPTKAFFDDILVGFAFAEVVPSDLIDIVPPNQPTVGVEVFDYPADATLAGQEGGTGWLGPWRSADGDVAIAAGNLASDRTCPEGSQANLIQSGIDTPVRLQRDFFAPFGAEERFSDFYISFTLDVADKAIGNAGTFGVIDGAGNNILAIGGVEGVSSLTAVVNESDPVTANAFTAAGTKWYVLKFEIDGVNQTATARVFVDPPSDAIPTDGSAVFTFENVALSGGIAGVEASGRGLQNVSFFLDDIRTGFSYRDISCQFGSDDPDLLFYEPFNYDVDLAVDGAGGINAFWDGPWFQFVEREINNAVITEGSIEFPDYEVSGNQARFELTVDGQGLELQRDFAFPVESDGSTYWLTFLMNTTVPDAENNIGILMLKNSGIGSSGGRRLGFGRNFGTRQLGSIVVPGNSPRTTDVDDNGTHWMVARISTSAEAAIPDTVSLWIDPALDVEPDTSDVSHYQFFTTTSLKEGFDAIVLRVLGVNGNEAPYTTAFDELILATRWQSARLLTNVISPQPTDPFALSVFPNPTVSELNISFSLPSAGNVTAELYSMDGRKAGTLISRRLPAGEQLLSTNVSNRTALPNGVYVLRLASGGKVTARKIILYR